MQCIHLVQFAAQLACRANRSQRYSIDDDGLQQYWALSKCRLQRWQQALRTFEQAVRNHPNKPQPYWAANAGLISEILFSDILGTVWTAMLYGPKNASPRNPLGHNIFESDREARERAVVLLELYQYKLAPETEQLRAARIQAELWTDLLLGYVTAGDSEVARGYQPSRVVDFAQMLVQIRQLGHCDELASQMKRDIELYFSRSSWSTSANGDVLEKTLQSIRRTVDFSASLSAGRPTLPEDAPEPLPAKSVAMMRVTSA